jgi:hypothetical protein
MVSPSSVVDKQCGAACYRVASAVGAFFVPIKGAVQHFRIG